MMFKIEPHQAQTLAWWYARRNRMDMDPPYQRKGRIWSIRDKQYLIDSIVNEYDIPKIYLADFSIFDSPLNSKRMLFAVVDGKQRLEAIFDFMENRMTLADQFLYESDPTL